MKLLLIVAILVSVPFSGVFGYTTADTNQINQLNAQALEYAYSNPQKGLALIEKIIALSRQKNFGKGEAMALIRKGIILDVISKPDASIQAYKEALVLAKKLDYKKGIGSIYNNIGLILMNQHKLSEARSYFQQAFDVFLEIRNDQLLSSVSNNLGMIYFDTGRNKEALKWFRKSLQYATNPVDEANTMANIGDLYHTIEKFDSAIFYIRKAINIYEKTDNTYSLGKSYNNFALVYSSQKKPKEAEIYYLKSLEIARKIENIPMLVSTGYNLGELYGKQGNLKKKGELLAEIYPHISEKGMEELAFKVCLAYASWYYHQGLAQKGDEMMAAYMKHHSAYFNEINIKNLNDIEKKYEVDKKEQENKLLKKSNELKTLAIKKNEQQSTIVNLIWAAGLFLVILLTLAIVLWFRHKNHQKELENQKAVFEATLAERKRISFDLHDNVGSQLSYVVSNLELLNQQNKMVQSNDSERIERTFKMSQEAIDSLRDTVWALHNSAITVELLSAKLESFARKVVDQKENLHLSYSHQIEQNQIISPENTMHIFRIFQESVNNVLKHAEAQNLEISLVETVEGKLNLQINDDGKGIECNQSPEGHFGLKNMSDRALQIGAHWKIEKKVSGGTIVSLEL